MRYSGTHITALLLAISLLFASAAFAEVDEFNIPVYKNAQGEVAFIIENSNAQRALRTIEVATNLLSDGIQSTIVFDKSGVLLAVNHTRAPAGAPTTPVIPIRVVSQKKIDNMEEHDEKMDKLEEVLFTETNATSRLNKLWALSAREEFVVTLNRFVSLGGEVIVCSDCLSKYGFSKANLVHSDISLDSNKLQKKLQGISYTR